MKSDPNRTAKCFRSCFTNPVRAVDHILECAFISPELRAHYEAVRRILMAPRVAEQSATY